MQLVAHAVLITFSGCLNGFRPLRWARILTLRRFCYFLGNLKCFSTIKTTTCVGLATYCTRVLITFSTCLNCFHPLRRTRMLTLRRFCCFSGCLKGLMQCRYNAYSVVFYSYGKTGLPRLELRSSLAMTRFFAFQAA